MASPRWQRWASALPALVLLAACGGGGTVAPAPPLGSAVLQHEGDLEPDRPLDAPYGVDVGPDGRVYVTDAGNDRVVVFEGTTQVDEWSGVMTEGFGGLAVAPSGEVVVIANAAEEMVQVHGPDGMLLRAFGTVDDGLVRPIGVAVDSAGRVLVTDDTAGVVVAFGLDGTAEGVVAEEGLAHPTGIAVIGEDLLVADYEAEQVVRIGPDGEVTGAWVEPGPAGSATVPEGLMVDRDGTVVVTGYETGLLGLLPTAPGEGPWPSLLGDRPAPGAVLSAPTDVAIGPDGTVYVVDQRQSRVAVFTREPAE